jgi:hypothetical protein
MIIKANLASAALRAPQACIYAARLHWTAPGAMQLYSLSAIHIQETPPESRSNQHDNANMHTVHGTGM